MALVAEALEGLAGDVLVMAEVVAEGRVAAADARRRAVGVIFPKIMLFMSYRSTFVCIRKPLVPVNGGDSLRARQVASKGQGRDGDEDEDSCNEAFFEEAKDIKWFLPDSGTNFYCQPGSKPYLAVARGAPS